MCPPRNRNLVLRIMRPAKRRAERVWLTFCGMGRCRTKALSPSEQGAEDWRRLEGSGDHADAGVGSERRHVLTLYARVLAALAYISTGKLPSTTHVAKSSGGMASGKDAAARAGDSTDIDGNEEESPPRRASVDAGRNEMTRARRKAGRCGAARAEAEHCEELDDACTQVTQLLEGDEVAELSGDARAAGESEIGPLGPCVTARGKQEWVEESHFLAGRKTFDIKNWYV